MDRSFCKRLGQALPKLAALRSSEPNSNAMQADRQQAQSHQVGIKMVQLLAASLQPSYDQRVDASGVKRIR